MTQTTILPLGATAEPSDSVSLESGEVATLGIFHASGQEFNLQFGAFKVVMLSPGEPILVGTLDSERRITQVFGPGVYQVLRPALGQPFGVSKDV